MSQLATPSPAPRSSRGGTVAGGTRYDAHAALVAPPSAALPSAAPPAVQPAALASGSGLQPERSSRSAADSPGGAATLKSDNAAARRSSSVVAETIGSRACSKEPAAAEAAGGRSGRGVVECHACSTPAARRAAACSRLLGLSWPLASRACRRSILRWLEFHRFLIALSVRPGSSLTISHPAHRGGPVVSNGREHTFGRIALWGAYIWAPFARHPPRLPGPPPPAIRSCRPRARGGCAIALGTACPFCPVGPFA